MLIPYGNRVLVDVVDDEITKSPGGIIIIDSEKNKRFSTGEIASVGSGNEMRDFKVGDIILFDKLTSNEVAKNQYLVGTGSIMAIVN